MPSHFIGLMSGTSLDGIDAVLVTLEPDSPLRVVAHTHAPFEESLRHELLSLNTAGANELHRAALAANALAREYAASVHALLAQAQPEAGAVRAIGAHGQTVRHRPAEFDGTGYTTQLLAPALLAELTGIDVACDFRSRDVAAGGQGAPLVPAFHAATFGHLARDVAVLNLGGISNLTVISEQRVRLGFDCGPANALMDHWCQRHRSTRFDAEGRWAASGAVDAALLTALLQEPYFAQRPPKSTGRDLFNPAWLERHLSQRGGALSPVDVQATLAELTARVCADALRAYAAGASELVLCGGGALNQHLGARFGALLPGLCVRASDQLGLPATQVEACAFAWLASALVTRHPGNLPQATGARGPRVLGALYPGH